LAVEQCIAWFEGHAFSPVLFPGPLHPVVQYRRKESNGPRIAPRPL
jgi:hypothetical protein